MRKPATRRLCPSLQRTNLQTASVGAPYTFLFKWMLTKASPCVREPNFHATDVVLPATGDVYTLSLIDEATQTQMIPALASPLQPTRRRSTTRWRPSRGHEPSGRHDRRPAGHDRPNHR